MDFEQFKRAAGLSEALARKWYEPLLKAYEQYFFYTPERMAMVLAQLGHESLGFARTIESFNYSRNRLLAVFPKYFSAHNVDRYVGKPQAIASRVYANRMGNGTETSGEGYRYRGRGLIQITGKDNYKQLGEGLGIFPEEKLFDLLENDPDIAAQSAMWWLWRNGVMDLIDGGNIEAVTRKINGGLNGIEDRKARYARAKGAL